MFESIPVDEGIQNSELSLTGVFADRVFTDSNERGRWIDEEGNEVVVLEIREPGGQVRFIYLTTFYVEGGSRMTIEESGPDKKILRRVGFDPKDLTE